MKGERRKRNEQDVVLAEVGVNKAAPMKDDSEDDEDFNVETALLVLGNLGVLEARRSSVKKR